MKETIETISKRLQELKINTFYLISLAIFVFVGLQLYFAYGHLSEQNLVATQIMQDANFHDCEHISGDSLTYYCQFKDNYVAVFNCFQHDEDYLCTIEDKIYQIGTPTNTNTTQTADQEVTNFA